MADSEKIDGPLTVTFSIEEQQLHQDLDTVMSFSKYVHAAFAEKIDKDRMTRKLVLGDREVYDDPRD